MPRAEEATLPSEDATAARGVESAREIEIRRFEGDGLRYRRDRVAVETPLVIVLNGEILVRLRCLPSHQDSLAVGFLLTEGLVEGPEEIRSVALAHDGMKVAVRADVPPARAERFRELLTLTTACGGGISSGHDMTLRHRADRGPNALRLAPETVFSVLAGLRRSAPCFHETGCTHSAILGGPSGILFSAEDVGRHNAVDKVVGLAVRSGVALRHHVVASSGRLTFEIIAKLARVGVPCVISRAAPSAQALDLAASFDMTVIGFARGRRFNAYTAAWRLHGHADAASID
jgi:FdhD protein